MPPPRGAGLFIPAFIARKPPKPVTAIAGGAGAVLVPSGTFEEGGGCGCLFVGTLSARRVTPPPVLVVVGTRPARAFAAVIVGVSCEEYAGAVCEINRFSMPGFVGALVLRFSAEREKKERD